MITFAALQQKIERLYPRVLKAHVEGMDIFPLVVVADKSLPDDFASWTALLEDIINHSADRMAFGYNIDYETRQTRRHGLQSVPVQFRFDRLEQLLGYLEKQDAFESFTADAAMILAAYPSLKPWLAANATRINDYHATWPSLLKVLDYFVTHPRPGLFARELPIGVHTKFTEQHKALLYELLNLVLPEAAINGQYTGPAQFEQRFGLRVPPQRIRLRMLDTGFAQQHTGGFTDLELTVEELAAVHWPLQQAIVLENKKSFENADIFLSLPAMHATAVLFGSGKAVSLLAKLPWLQPIPIYYWGDMDAEGFEMLHHLRVCFPQTRSFCMDMASFRAFEAWKVGGSGASAKMLPLLTGEEQQLYTLLCTHNWRLEQELVAQDYVLRQLQGLR